MVGLWSPYQLNHINQSSIFNTVLKDILSRIYFNLPHDYSAFFTRTVAVNMRIFFVPSDWWMATKRHIDCPALLSSIDLSILKGTRSRSIFCRHYHLTSYAYNSKISRLFRTGDQINIIVFIPYSAALLLSCYYFSLLLCCYLLHVLYTWNHFKNCILLY